MFDLGDKVRVEHAEHTTPHDGACTFNGEEGTIVEVGSLGWYGVQMDRDALKVPFKVEDLSEVNE